MRILLIGGTRFIGPEVARLLHEAGDEISVFHRGQSRAPMPTRTRQILGNRHFLSDFADGFRQLAPEIVIDMFPMTELDATRVMKTFKGIARRVVMISSADVYRAFDRLSGRDPGPPDPVPLREDSPLREMHFPYRGRIDSMANYEKILVERVAMSDPDLPATLLRLPMVYGPRDAQHRIHPFLRRMDDDRRAIFLPKGVADWKWTRGYVENVAAAVVAAVHSEKASGKIYNVGEPLALSMREWVRAIGEATDWIGEIIVLPEDSLPPYLRFGIDCSQDLVSDTKLIREDLDYEEPVLLNEGIRRTIAWTREHPPERIDPALFDYAKEDQLLRDWKRNRK
jgi:nucleoside-diphosphate-sugar epimerase